jgi:L-iditol 2-dehydrogenase
VVAVDVRPERVASAAAVLGDDIARATGDGLREAAGPDGWSVVIIAAGAAAAVDLAMAQVAPSGRVLAFAGLPPAAAVVPIDVNRIHYQQIELIGAFGGTPSTYARAVAWLAASDLALDELVTDEFELGDALDAYRNVESGRGLKTVLRGPAAD